ncbi:beta-lactamase-like protein [Multifurca ochricompacta]|uniref:Beta-lactamase-like protein n=1 Tax=Multifurca ochricompacta TaxID=376703 RepID=A0AAD4QPS4_9AGAM|nr:beta-lactamase-like protein [Multifurca ochricompacta]
MEKLEVLKSITRLSDRVVRVLGQNPGKFTLQGTNTYIIGTSNPYILVDTGEGKQEYSPLLRAALESPKLPSLPDISDIILTHRHQDHVCGLPFVLSLCRELWTTRNPETPFIPPRIHKFPLPSPNSDSILNELVYGLREGDYVPTPGGNHFHDLADGQTVTPSVLPPGSDPGDWTLKVLHCPGHTIDSISLLFPADRALLTADTVLGQGTAVFEDLYEYMGSLQNMYDTRDKYDTLYPGHGPVVHDGADTIRTYIDHRLEREAQVLGVLRKIPPDGSWTTWAIVLRVYEGYPDSLLEAAARGIQLHLKKLEKEGRVKALGGELREARWELVR